MMPSGAGASKPSLTREKTKEIFLYTEEKKMDSMKKLMNNPSRYQSDPMESMLEMMIEQAKLSDELHELYNTEEDDFNAAVIQYNLMNDPEVQRIMEANMKKLGLGGAMGGMGGMGGMAGGY